MSKELLVIEKLELVPFFTKGDQLDDVLAKIEAEAMSHVADVSTLKGRNAVKKVVTMVTSSKTFLEKNRKSLADEYKAIPKMIDANGKIVRDFLTDLQARVREPLTAWEDEQKVIEAEELAKAEALKVQAQRDDDHELATWEFKEAMSNREIEKQRLIQIRIEQDEFIKKQAAAKAKEKAESESAEKLAQAKREKEALELEAEQLKQNAKNAEWLTYIAEAYDINSNIDHEKREEMARWVEYISEAYLINDRMDAKKKSDLEVAQATENARLAQIQQQKNDQLQQEQEQRQLEANKQFTRGVKTKVMNDFISAGIDSDTARLVTQILAANKIRNAQIVYK